MEPQVNAASSLFNASNISISSSPDLPKSLTALQIIAMLIFVSTSVVGLAAYVLVLVVLHLYVKEFKSNFYYFVISLALVDMGFLLMVLVYMVPSTIQQRDILFQSVLPGLISGFCFLAGCIHLAFIGIYRLISVSVPPSMNHIVDEYLNNKWFVIICSVVFWVVGTSDQLVMLYWEGCNLSYDERYMAFSLIICDGRSLTEVDNASLVVRVVSWIVPLSIGASHLLPWIVVYMKGAGMSNEIKQKRKRERVLLVQFTLISMAALLFDGSFWLVPKVFSDHPEGFVIITLFGIASTAVNPFTYLVYNSVMKKKAKYLVFVLILRRSDNAVTLLGTGGAQPKVNDNGGGNQRNCAL